MIVGTTVIVGIFRFLRFQGDVVADVFTANAAVGNVKARGPAIIVGDGVAFFIVIFVFRFAVEEAEANGVTGIVEVGMRIGEDIVLIGISIAAKFPADIDLIASTAEVGFTEAEDTD